MLGYSFNFSKLLEIVNFDPKSLKGFGVDLKNKFWSLRPISKELSNKAYSDMGIVTDDIYQSNKKILRNTVQQGEDSLYYTTYWPK